MHPQLRTYIVYGEGGLNEGWGVFREVNLELFEQGQALLRLSAAGSIELLNLQSESGSGEAASTTAGTLVDKKVPGPSLQLQACQGSCNVSILCQFGIPGLVRLASNHLVTFDAHTGELD